MDQPVKQSELPVSRLFSLRMGTIARLSELSEKTGMNKSQIVREAVDEYYMRHQGDQPKAESK